MVRHNYHDAGATAACVVFEDWRDDKPVAAYTSNIAEIEPYQPGQFYKRELPCVLSVLGKVHETVDIIIIDGYVWLRDADDPGLGAHLFKALEQSTPIIGVAKSQFDGSKDAMRVYRGDSAQPLFVTARGLGLDQAAECLRAMHGPYRIPSMLRRVDQLCRGISS